MATPVDYGIAHFYGLRGDSVYMTVQSDSISDTFKLDVEVADETGRVITNHLDDEFFEISIEGVLLQTDSLPDNGSQFSYGGRQYILKNIDDKGTNKDFRKVSVKGVKYQQIA